MQPNKIENDFKNKLNEREIKPTSQAWDRLDAMLTVAEEKKPKRKYSWLLIAASILVIFSVGIGFFIQNDKIIGVKNEVVIKNKSIPNQEKAKSIIPLTSIPETVVVIAEAKKVESAKDKKQFATPTENLNITNQNQVTENPIIHQKDEQESIIPQKQEVAIVEKQITIQKPLKKPTVKVDASSLLSEVDNELELTFREKAIKAINKNYKTVKVALANRNME